MGDLSNKPENVPSVPGFLVADEGCRGHLAGRTHPERPERYDAVMGGLARAGLLGRMRRAAVRTATEDELLLCHTAEYLKTARRDVESGQRYLSTGDTDITSESWEVAVRAVGGVLNAVDAVLSGEARNAFCAVRPPGPSCQRGTRDGVLPVQ